MGFCLFPLVCIRQERAIGLTTSTSSTVSRRRNGSYIQPDQRFTSPANRIKQWQIGPGDKVRLLRGDDAEKFVDPERGRLGGWKQYEVDRIEPKFNRGVSERCRGESFRRAGGGGGGKGLLLTFLSPLTVRREHGHQTGQLGRNGGG